MTIQQNIVSILTQCRDEIRANMSAKGINASGRTSAGFKVVQRKDGIALILDRSQRVQIPCEPRPKTDLRSVWVGVAPLETLETGKPAGKVPRGFYYMIKQWTRDKGIQFGSESERQRFAYFTAQKIVREGTKRHAQPEDVYSTPVKKATEQVRNSVLSTIAISIRNAKMNF